MRYLLPAIGLAFTAMVVAPVTPLPAQEANSDPAGPRTQAEPTPISEVDQLALTQALDRGLLLYRHDQTAWHATDAMLEDLRDPAALGVAGWIINRTDLGHEAVFYTPTSDGFEAVWSGEYDGEAVSNRRQYEQGERSLTPAETAMIAAQKAPFRIETDYSLCSERLNQVVFPTGKDDGGFYVYLLMPQPAIDQIPFGGHYRFEVVDGEVVSHRRFTNSCVTMPLTNDAGDRPAALGISHLLDPVPTEIHVFSMFAAGLPINVVTSENERVWVVEASQGQPRVRLIKE